MIHVDEAIYPVNYSRLKSRASYELLPCLRMSLQTEGMDMGRLKRQSLPHCF
ncbi:hypothetical protein SAMN04488076_1031, partial [Trichococcus palustris]